MRMDHNTCCDDAGFEKGHQKKQKSTKSVRNILELYPLGRDLLLRFKFALQACILHQVLDYSIEASYSGLYDTDVNSGT
eukprot:4040296-Amphidinium_carterae.1